MSWFRRIAERAIETARDEGDLDRLPGAGRPLPRATPGDVDAVEEAGYRAMRKAGTVPPEVALMQRVAAERRALAETADPEARRAAMKALADTQMRLAMMTERRRGLKW